MGLVAHVAVVLLVLLIFVNVASDILYMVPLAVVDVRLIAVNWLVSGRFSRGLTRTGIVAGIGLVVLGASALGIAVFVAPAMLEFKGTVTQIDPAMVNSAANLITHIGLLIGALMGRAVYPIWAHCSVREAHDRGEGSLLLTLSPNTRCTRRPLARW